MANRYGTLINDMLPVGAIRPGWGARDSPGL